MEQEVPTLPQPGDLVAGRFRTLELLGTGGFGTVYRAVQENVGRDVAMKFLTPGVARDPVNVERFRREAYHVSQLRHPNTITLYDYGQTEDGLIYMVMELLEGESLADVIQSHGAMEWPRAAHIFIQVLKSLSEAHQRGLVHRDLKPENIFLSELLGEQDFVKVLDFGVAKMTMLEDLEESEEKLTKAGRIFGTPMYMAPEQACAEPITPATDVYALGLLIFEMLTGLPPVTGRNRMDVIHKQIRDEVPELTRELQGTALGDFIRKACEKKPTKRFHDAAEMVEGFIQAIHQMNIQPRARGATHPEISVTSLVPTTLPDEGNEDETVAGSSVRLPEELQPPVSAQDSDATVEALRPASEDEIETGPTAPVPEKTRKSTSPPPLPVAPQHQRTAQRKTVTERLAEKERSRKNPFGDKPHSRPRYELPLIGREQDVLRIADLIQEAAWSASGHIVMLEGEAGVGKSRVIDAVRSNLRNVGIDVCLGYCRRRSSALEPLREALADFWGVGHVERMQVDSVVRADLSSLGGHTDQEIDFIVEFIRPRASEDEKSPGPDEEGVLFARLERVLVQLAERRPLLLVLEDLQYADPGTLAFLEYFAVTLRTQQAPIAMITSLRPEERRLNRNLGQSLRQIASNVGARFTRYPLRRLRGRDLSVLLDSILPLEGRLKERIGWLSQGVPMHAIQIVRYLQSEGNLIKKGQRWGVKSGSPREIDLPPDLMDLMRLRIELATQKHSSRPSLAATLEWLATLGMRTPVELLSMALGGSGGSASLDQDLNTLREEGIVRQTMHQNLTCVEFDNSLLREAILRDLSERWANRRLHQVVADKKIEFYQNKGLEVPLVEIAEHWRQAGNHDQYRDTLFAAAQNSFHKQDARGAREQFLEVIGLLEANKDRSDQWIEAQLALAELAWRLGEFGLAEDHFRRVIEESTPGELELGKALRGIGHLLLLQSRHREAAAYYRRALDHAQKSQNQVAIAKALVGLSRVHIVQGDLRAEEPVRTKLEEMLPDLPSGSDAGKVLLHLAEVSRRRGQLAKRRDYLLRARTAFEHARDRQGLSDALLNLGSALMEPTMDAPDRLQEAGKLLRQTLELKKQLGDRMGMAESFRYLGQLELELENYEGAHELLRQSLSIHEAVGAPYTIGATHNSLGVVKIFLKDYDSAQFHFQTSIDTFQQMGDQLTASHAMMNLGELEFNRGDIARAQALLREARRIKESMGSSWKIYDILNHLAMVSMWLGEFEEAQRLLEDTLENVDTDGTGEDRAVARSLLGLLRCFQSRLHLAALELGRARADAEELGMPKVAIFCEANAAFYTGLTESEGAFAGHIEKIINDDIFYTLERTVWLQLLDRMAIQVSRSEKHRQSVRLLNTTARLWGEFGYPDRQERLVEVARELERELNDARH